jgi:hypothetical protein
VARPECCGADRALQVWQLSDGCWIECVLQVFSFAVLLRMAGSTEQAQIVQRIVSVITIEMMYF